MIRQSYVREEADVNLEACATEISMTAQKERSTINERVLIMRGVHSEIQIKLRICVRLSLSIIAAMKM
jgi:hypothetical protein